MIFWLACVLFPQSIGVRFCVEEFFIGIAIELAKLIPFPWLATLRHTQAGALVLKTGFHIGNIACCALGTWLGLAREQTALPRLGARRG